MMRMVRFDDVYLYRFDRFGQPEWLPKDEATKYPTSKMAHAMKRIARKYVGDGAVVVRIVSRPPSGEDPAMIDNTLECSHGYHDLSCDCIAQERNELIEANEALATRVAELQKDRDDYEALAKEWGRRALEASARVADLEAAVKDLLPMHSGSCCTFDAAGKVIVTQSSCRCAEREHLARILIGEWSPPSVGTDKTSGKKADGDNQPFRPAVFTTTPARGPGEAGISCTCDYQARYPESDGHFTYCAIEQAKPLHPAKAAELCPSDAKPVGEAVRRLRAFLRGGQGVVTQGDLDAIQTVLDAVPCSETALADEVLVRGRIVQHADKQAMIQFSHGYAWVKKSDLTTLGSLDRGEPTTTPGRGPKEGPGTLTSSVYLVTCCYTEPERIIGGVFSTRKKAEEGRRMLTADGDRWPEWEIDEWEVDAVPTGSTGEGK